MPGPVAARFVKHGRQKPKDKGLQSRDASAGSADIDLDSTPHQRQRGVVGKIGLAAKSRAGIGDGSGRSFGNGLLKVVDSNDIHDSNEDTKSKSNDKNGLLPRG